MRQIEPPFIKPSVMTHVKANYQASIIAYGTEHRNPYIEADNISDAMQKLQVAFGKDVQIKGLREITMVEMIV